MALLLPLIEIAGFYFPTKRDTSSAGHLEQINMKDLIQKMEELRLEEQVQRQNLPQQRKCEEEKNCMTISEPAMKEAGSKPRRRGCHGGKKHRDRIRQAIAGDLFQQEIVQNQLDDTSEGEVSDQEAVVGGRKRGRCGVRKHHNMHRQPDAPLSGRQDKSNALETAKDESIEFASISEAQQDEEDEQSDDDEWDSLEAEDTDEWVTVPPRVEDGKTSGKTFN